MCKQPKILLLTALILSLLILLPQDAYAQYVPSSESKPGLSNGAVILGGVLIGVAVITAIVIINKTGKSDEEEEVTPYDSTEVGLLLPGVSVNDPWTVSARKENYESTCDDIYDRQIALSKRLCPIMILKKDDFYIGLEIQF